MVFSMRWFPLPPLPEAGRRWGSWRPRRVRSQRRCAFSRSPIRSMRPLTKRAARRPIFKEAWSIFLDLMEADADHFVALMDAYPIPGPADEAGLAERSERILAALKRSAEAPAQIAQITADLLPLFTKVLQKGHSASSRTASSRRNTPWQRYAAILHVRINLKSIRDEFYVHEQEETIRTWEKACSAIGAMMTCQVQLSGIGPEPQGCRNNPSALSRRRASGNDQIKSPPAGRAFHLRGIRPRKRRASAAAAMRLTAPSARRPGREASAMVRLP